ncbi:hypothetical protein [Microbulbifer agarilyticus]
MSITIALLCLIVIGVLDGFASQYFYPGVGFPPTSVWFSLAIAFVGFAWYVRDSNLRKYKRNIFLNICIIGFGLIALPYYFFRSRGLKGGLLATLVLLLVLVIWTIALMSGEQIALLVQK